MGHAPVEKDLKSLGESGMTWVQDTGDRVEHAPVKKDLKSIGESTESGMRWVQDTGEHVSSRTSSVFGELQRRAKGLYNQSNQEGKSFPLAAGLLPLRTNQVCVLSVAAVAVILSALALFFKCKSIRKKVKESDLEASLLDQSNNDGIDCKAVYTIRSAPDQTMQGTDVSPDAPDRDAPDPPVAKLVVDPVAKMDAALQLDGKEAKVMKTFTPVLGPPKVTNTLAASTEITPQKTKAFAKRSKSPEATKYEEFAQKRRTSVRNQVPEQKRRISVLPSLDASAFDAMNELPRKK